MSKDSKIIALVDCNNFYVSCERVFNPKLEGKPAVVLSNNDGCVISRSDEAKLIGIEMGVPIFKCQELVEKHKIQVLSSNFVLYGDMSHRVMKTLSIFCPEIEIYSIDEAFLSFSGMDEQEINEYCRLICKTVYKWVGIPISIGIGPTKTLAKVANKIAKKNKKATGGVFNLTDHPDIDKILENIEVGDIWGIGRQYSKFLKKNGVMNAFQLRNSPDDWLHKNLTVVGMRTVLELRGIPCIELEIMQKNKKAIGRSRSFGTDLFTLEELNQAVSTFVTMAGEYLRKQKSLASGIQIFVISNPFKEGPRYFNSVSINLPRPTAFVSELINYALQGLKTIFREGVKYKKAGILLFGLVPDDITQLDFFLPSYQGSKEKKLMEVLDIINTKYGKNTIYPLSNGVERKWKMRQLKKSPSYTTNWTEIPEVKS